MTKIISSKMKYCRTTSCQIYGSRKFKNPTPPGQHGKRKRKLTEYCKQIRETKKLRLFYGNIKLGYLQTVYEKASACKGNKIDKLIEILERRLSTIVFRAKFAASIFTAKQMVSHGLILVNGKRVDISSYLVSPNDVITLKNSIRENHHVLTALSSLDRETPPFLECSKNFEVTFTHLPSMRAELFPFPVDLQKIIEFLS